MQASKCSQCYNKDLLITKTGLQAPYTVIGYTAAEARIAATIGTIALFIVCLL